MMNNLTSIPKHFARLDITLNEWLTYISITVQGTTELLLTTVAALDAIGVNAMLSCRCGTYEFGACENKYCQAIVDKTSEVK